MTRPVADRLWSKVEKPPGDGCWLWTGARDSDGYGRISVGGRIAGTVRAHRLAWELLVGPIPPETPHVLHNCPGGDNPLCVRHLWLGTNTDNMRDKVAKGRHPRGERSATAKLTETQVLEIRRLHGEGHVTQSALARRFGITKQTVADILTRHTWAHLAPGQK